MKSFGLSNNNSNDVALDICLNLSESVSSCGKKKVEELFSNDIWSHMILKILSLIYDLNLSCSFLIALDTK